MGEVRRVQVLENILKANDYLADRLRREWDEQRTFVVNLLSGPGAGKTTLLEASLRRMKNRYRIAVLEGDIETERDAERIRALGIPAFQITTGGTCHLEAHMVEQAWKMIQADSPFDFLFIENVGNLICPASYTLGEHLRIVLLSVPEGDDKPQKYPRAFRSSQVFLITKADLLPHFDFSVDRARADALILQGGLKNQVVSSRTGEGIDQWIQLLERERENAFPQT